VLSISFVSIVRLWGEGDGAVGRAGGGDIRAVQRAGCCKHAVGVCENGAEAGGAAYGADGGEAEAANSKISLYTWALKRYLNTCRDLGY
jgi:hypothetical protein